MDNQRLFEQLIDEKNQAAWMQETNSIDTNAALERIKGRMSFVPRKKNARIRNIWVYGAAAAVLLFVVIGFWLVKTNKGPDQAPPIAQVNANDLWPGKDRAVLTLSDGKTIALDSIQAGKSIQQDNTFVSIDSGRLAYSKTDAQQLVSHVDYNTLTVPAGGQYKIVLPDGTRVWLNAASSLKYPVTFTGSKRSVELTGEGYFEVAKDASHPFEVRALGSVVQVLGTHFNVNAYSNEPALRVVLAEGSVKLNESTLLKPGEQASIAADGKVKTTAADVETTLAWTKGEFNFKETPLPDILRQIARWYDASVEDQTQITEHFNAKISRRVPVSRLLHFLEGTGTVHFKIEDKKIIVIK